MHTHLDSVVESCTDKLRSNWYDEVAGAMVCFGRAIARTTNWPTHYIAIHGVNSFGSPFPSCSFIFAFGVPSTSPATEAVAMIGAIKWLMLEKCSMAASASR